MFNIHLLPAAYGDSILIEYGENKPHYVLIDGGPYYNFDELVAGLSRVAPELKELELLVITHIDIDHIDGVVTMLKKTDIPFTVKDIWFNGFEQLEQVSKDLGALQGEYITELITTKELPHNLGFDRNPVMVDDYNDLPRKHLDGGLELTLLGPGKMELERLEKQWKKEVKKYGKKPDFASRLAEDTRYDSDAWLGTDPIDVLQDQKVIPDRSAPNGSSIAFIATYNSKKTCLLAGDATSDCLLKAIDPLLAKLGEKKLRLDAWKLSHHGSKKSNLEKLMRKIDCKKMLISTNGAKFSHPDDACIAKVLKHTEGAQFFFNYRTEYNERWADEALQEQYGFKAFYPEDNSRPGISVKL